MTISDEAVEVAAKAFHGAMDAPVSRPEDWREEMRAALEAAAPFIRAEALTEAGEALDELWKWRRARFDRDWADGVEESETLLRARAAEMRQG